jgi:hypothetical protein
MTCLRAPVCVQARTGRDVSIYSRGTNNKILSEDPH